MNELFHVISGIGIAAMLTDTEAVERENSFQNKMPTIFYVFSVGIISHAILDYLPHTYPIEPKVDVILSIILASILIILSKRSYRLIVASSLLGCIFPDIIDIGPKMLHVNFGFSIPIHSQIFPWHWKSYSGSLYKQGYTVSAINHALIFILLLIVFRTRRKHLKNLFSLRPL
jgi:hypothetical protein